MSPALASDIKTSLTKELPENLYKESSRPGTVQDLIMEAAGGYKTATEEAVRRALPDAPRQLGQVNEELGALLTARKTFDKGARKATLGEQMVPSQVDAMLLSLANPAAFAAKKAVTAARTPDVLTRAGLGLYDVGKGMSKLTPESDVYRILLNQAIQQAARANQGDNNE
jgi:hypothetical protein